MHISKHTVWGKYEMMNISCCQILESNPLRMGVYVSPIMGSKGADTSVAGLISKIEQNVVFPVPKPLGEHSVVFSFKCILAGRQLLHTDQQMPRTPQPD